MCPAAAAATHIVLLSCPRLLQSTINAAEVDARAVVVVAASLADSQKRITDVAAPCEDTYGRYGVMVGNFKVCPLCASGTYGDGYGCTPCDAGTSSEAGSSSCSTCQAGSYAQSGERAAAG